MTSSLGIIETRGFVPAVEAADTAVKTADISLIGCRLAGAGLVSIFLTGDVSSVQSAVASGAAAAKRLGEVVSTSVIARMAEGLAESFLPTPPQSNPDPSCTADEVASSAPVPPSAAQDIQVAGSRPSADALPATDAELARLSVNRLRSLARTLPDLALDKAAIKFALKEQLIAAIIAARNGKKL